MKYFLTIFFVVFIHITTNGQAIVEDKTGEKIAFTLLPSGINQGASFLNLNVGSQSIGFDYYRNTSLRKPHDYQIHEFSIRAKPTEGYASVIKNGQFSPGIKLSYSITQYPLLSGSADYTDWAGISIGYDVNKYLLFNKDTSFANQVYSQSYRGLNIGLNYNALIKSRWIMSLRVGYARNNNFETMNALEVNDMRSFPDPVSGVVRETVKTRNVREGSFKEFDSYPVIISFTRVTQTDSLQTKEAKMLRLGYTIYFKSIASKDLPRSNFGILFFLTRQNSSGVRLPVFGIHLQANDPFDVENKNNGLQKRIEIGFTTSFSL